MPADPLRKNGIPARRTHARYRTDTKKRRQTIRDTKKEGYEEKNGRGERIRTSGLYVPNVALYQAKLHPEMMVERLETSFYREGC